VKRFRNPLTSKGVSANEDGMWPAYDAHESVVSALRRSLPFTNYLLFSNTPYWQSLTNIQGLFDWFHVNPVFYATIMIKAREYANMRIKVINRWTGLEEPSQTRKVIPAKLYALFNKPNVLQSRW